jgi:hypothetical protein
MNHFALKIELLNHTTATIERKNVDISVQREIIQ